MNVPYVKKYDENGVLTNPIVGVYSSPFENRRMRNQKRDRAFNNRGNSSVNVVGGDVYKSAYRVASQFIALFKGKATVNKKGEIKIERVGEKPIAFKRIVHYVPKNI